MYLEWYKIVALVLTVPGVVVLYVALMWSMTMITSFHKEKSHHHDQFAAFLRIIAFMIVGTILSTFALGYFVFGLVGLLYACGCFALFIKPSLNMIRG